MSLVDDMRAVGYDAHHNYSMQIDRQYREIKDLTKERNGLKKELEEITAQFAGYRAAVEAMGGRVGQATT